MKRVLSATILACMAMWPQFAHADVASDMQKMTAAWQAQKAIHADEHFSNGTTISVDMVAPDRIKVMPSNGGGEMVIGNQMWVNNKGSWTKMPAFMGSMVTKTVNKYRQAPMQDVDVSSIKDLGMQSVGGKRLHAYSYVVHNIPETLWVDANYLPMQALVQDPKLTTTIVYSYGNVSIDPP